MNKTGKQKVSKAKKIYRAVSGTISALIFIFLIIVIGLLIWQRSSGKDTSLFGYYMFDVVTESMEPTIMTHDVILCQNTDATGTVPTLKKNRDVITFTAPSGPLRGQNITHRIFDIIYNEDGSINYIKTAGDNKYGGDAVKVDDWQLKPSAVKAVYVRTLPVIGALRSFIMKPYGFFVLVVLPLLAVGVMTIIGYVKDKTKIESEKVAANAEAAGADVTLDDLSEEEKQKLLDAYFPADQYSAENKCAYEREPPHDNDTGQESGDSDNEKSPIDENGNGES